MSHGPLQLVTGQFTMRHQGHYLRVTQSTRSSLQVVTINWENVLCGGLFKIS
jgi:hypothetical protein